MLAAKEVKRESGWNTTQTRQSYSSTDSKRKGSFQSMSKNLFVFLYEVGLNNEDGGMQWNSPWAWGFIFLVCTTYFLGWIHLIFIK